MPTGNEELACLSMHQPWASLLVYGIKRIEGRTWDCQHRGRLWIHATAKAVDPSDVEELHTFYTQIHSLDGQVPNFPPAYPTGVLLGCVEVVDVVPTSVLERWPGLPESCRLEASSPFSFLCQNPKRLVVPQQLKGQQRIWQLPRATLKIALQGLRDPPGLPPFSWRDFGNPSALSSQAPVVPPAAAGGPRTKDVAAAQPRPKGHEQPGRTGSDDS
ncbi:hypothetical protein Vretimale_17285 [Volvox reticuliferus]|uniref:ASCH domain-containing protein n=1 Tax=Volvox reticuliferus TaxID=1737510 RepID=A0A8J4GVD3_9CHLO|nr:hypothetical protein Vretifemale_16618 [Volvox reticuliferus]GIM14269.1 hypothetical protein Vretimale_17285 [Volvox reticuliferus]